MAFGNKIWTTNEFFGDINTRYLERLDAIYQTDFGLIPAENPEKTVNDWVRGVTKGKIQELFGKLLLRTNFENKLRMNHFFVAESIPQDVSMLLTNAIYFKDAWNVAFTEVPDLKPFTLSTGTKIQAKYMTRASFEFSVFEFELRSLLQGVKFTAASIPYAVSKANNIANKQLTRA